MDKNIPAFPGIKIISERIEMNHYKDKQVPYEGMTLRDYMAGQIINGICSNQFYMTAILEDFKDPDDNKHKEKLAEISYELADAMLAERAKDEK